MPIFCNTTLLLPAIAAFMVLLPPAHAAEYEVPQGASPHSAGALQAKLFLTADEKELRRIWEASPTPPRLPTTERVRLGHSASTVIVFKGCEANAAGRCEVGVDFAVTGPDGKAQNAGSASLWSSAPLGQKFMLGEASATLKFNGDEDLGAYTVRARVVDRVAKRQLELSAPLRVER